HGWELSAALQWLRDAFTLANRAYRLLDDVLEPRVLEHVLADLHGSQELHAAGQQRGQRTREARHGDQQVQPAEQRQPEFERVPLEPASSGGLPALEPP